MTSEQPSARPSQVTVAGWAVAIASAVLVVTVFDAMGQLHSVDMRDRITRAITSGSAQNLGLTLGGATEILRWALMVSGVAAVAAGIFGVFVLQRHQAARIGLTIAAVPVVLTAPAAGSLPGMVIGAGAALLWSRPARDWFAGRPVRPTQTAVRTADRPTPTDRGPMSGPVPGPPTGFTQPPRVDPSTPLSQLPPPTPSWGQPVATQQPAPQFAPVDPLGRAFAQRAPWPSSASRPLAVRLACIVTWVFTGLTAFGSVLALIGVALNQDEVVDLARRSDQWDPELVDVIVPATLTLAALVLVWCVGTAVLTYFTWRGRAWAWALLIASAAMAGLFSLLLAVGYLAVVVWTAGIGIVLGWLVSRPARDWFSRSRTPYDPPPPPPPTSPW